MRKNKKFGLFSVLLAVFMIAIIILANYGAELLCKRYPLKADISENKMYSLSEYTKTALKDLEKEVDVFAIYSTGSENDFILEILYRYQRETEKVNVSVVGEKEMPELSYKYDKGNNGLSNGSFIFVCGDKFRIVTENDLSDYNLYTRQETEMYAEEQFTQAILEVTSDATKTVYTISGHGTDDGGLDGILSKNGYVKKEISLVNNEIPEDCTVLMLRNPATDLSQTELAALDEYLYNGGSLLLLFNPAVYDLSGTYAYLSSRWNINVTNELVVEMNPNRTQNGREFFASGAGHEIGKNILDVNDANGYVLASFSKSVEPIAGTKAKCVMRTTESGFKIPFGMIENEEDMMESIYAAGQASIAATSEMNEGKIAVFGSSYYFVDSVFENPDFVNKELFLNTLEWLHGNKINTGIRPKSLIGKTLTITQAQQNIITVLIVLFPLLILAYGIYTWIRRVHK
ncbi:MAG: GldG family protein [Clostridia bacterium]|nr:GldG family protein [Clostridia bacterium]